MGTTSTFISLHQLHLRIVLRGAVLRAASPNQKCIRHTRPLVARIPHRSDCWHLLHQNQYTPTWLWTGGPLLFRSLHSRGWKSTRARLFKTSSRVCVKSAAARYCGLGRCFWSVSQPLLHHDLGWAGPQVFFRKPQGWKTHVWLIMNGWKTPTPATTLAPSTSGTPNRKVWLAEHEHKRKLPRHNVGRAKPVLQAKYMKRIKQNMRKKQSDEHLRSTAPALTLRQKHREMSAAHTKELKASCKYKDVCRFCENTRLCADDQERRSRACYKARRFWYHRLSIKENVCIYHQFDKPSSAGEDTLGIKIKRVAKKHFTFS